MAFVNAFTAPFRTSFTPLLSAKKCTGALLNYKPIWTGGWIITTTSVHIAVNTALEKHLGKLSRKISRLPKQNCWSI